MLLTKKRLELELQKSHLIVLLVLQGNCQLTKGKDKNKMVEKKGLRVNYSIRVISVFLAFLYKDCNL